MVASSGFDLPLIVDDAVQLAGGLSMTAQDVQNARTSLWLLLNEWENKGYNTWRIKQNVDFTLLEASASVTLTRTPAIDDVVEARVLLQTDSYTPLRRISPAEYGRMSTPDNIGLPTQFYLERTDTPTLYCYPIGRAGQDETLRLTIVERPAAFDRLSGDVDAPARWLNAIVHGVALGVARRRPVRDENRIADLNQEYARAATDALGADRARIPWRLR